MRYRSFTSHDFEALVALDQAVLRHEDPHFEQLPEREREARTRTSLAALRFFERSEHSFVAEDDRGLRGAVFAQSVWQGDRPIVLIARLWLVPGEADATAAGLLHACSKSAYDTAVYELHLAVNGALAAAATAEDFRVQGQYAVRWLGARATTAPAAEEP